MTDTAVFMATNVPQIAVCPSSVQAPCLKPWQLPPVSYFKNNDPTARCASLMETHAARGSRSNLQKLLTFGLIRFEPDPFAALERVEAAKNQPAK